MIVSRLTVTVIKVLSNSFSSFVKGPVNAFHKNRAAFSR